MHWNRLLGALQQEQLIVLGRLPEGVTVTRTEDFLYERNVTAAAATASSSTTTPTPHFRATTTSPWRLGLNPTAALVRAAPTANEMTEAATRPVTPLRQEDDRQTGTGTD